MNVVTVKQEPIELYKVLKMENLVQSGGEAKFVITERLVSVNGLIETRKRRKIYSGDQIVFQEYEMEIAVDNEASDEQT